MIFTSSQQVEKVFYDAFQQRDIELMTSVWEASDQVCCIHPGAQRLFGFDEIMKSWEQIFAVKSEMAITISAPIYVRQDANAIHYVKENISVQNEYMGVICATNIYRETSDGWNIILHHASALMAEQSAPKQFH